MAKVSADGLGHTSVPRRMRLSGRDTMLAVVLVTEGVGEQKGGDEVEEYGDCSQGS